VRVIIVSGSVPLINGGGRLIASWTAEAMRAVGHEVEEFYIPFPVGHREVLPALVAMRALPFLGSADRLVAMRWPAHVVRHDNKATWFIHHYRELFDLWDSEHRPVADNAEGLAYRELVRRADQIGLAESRDLFANSLVVRDRLRLYNRCEAEPLYPPLGGDVSKFRNDGNGGEILYVSRITPIKRQLLAVEALRHTTSGVRLVIAGNPESAPYAQEIREYVTEHSLEDRVDLRFGWISEEEKAELLSRCLAVAYLPFNEDSYGYTSLEASHSEKPIVTLSDSGGALEFVRDGVEGFVVDPDPRDLAVAFDRLYEDRDGAERMGERSAARRAELGISWDRVVARLLGETA
jgi:glycosyltransferase involved in cell wall biosynthesis